MADPALIAPPVDLAPAAKYRADQRLFQGIPGVAFSKRQLWATWYTGSHDETPQNHVAVGVSDDRGVTWTDPLLVIDPPGEVRAYDPTMWLDPLGRLWLFWAQSLGKWDGRSGVWAIRNDNPDEHPLAWSAPRRLCHGIMMNKPTALRDGTWMIPSSIWSVGAEHPETRHMRLANAYASTDQGESWEWRGGVAMPTPIFDEHHIVERVDGSLWMLARTWNGVGESISTDGGRTWSPGRHNDIPCPNSRFHISRLASGRLLLVNHHNYVTDPNSKGWGGRNHLTAMLSDDDGKSWFGHLLLDERQSVSYPDAAQAEDGTIAIVYDRCRKTDREILLALVREEEIAAGRMSAPGSCLRRIVSKGTGTA